MLQIKKCILHILDTSIGSPILSDRLMNLDEEIADYVTTHFDKLFGSNALERCEFSETSSFLTLIKTDDIDFVALSQDLANNLYNLMLRNDSIPRGDLLVAILQCNNIDYFAVAKLDYKTSYIHYYQKEEADHYNTIIMQPMALPSPSYKIAESFFVNLNNYVIALQERKYEIDGVKDYYWSTYILNCSKHPSEKSKFSAISRNINKLVEKHYGNDLDKDNVSSLLYEAVHDDEVYVEQIYKEISSKYPKIEKDFEILLNKYDVQISDKIKTTDNDLKKIKNQSLKTEYGVEIKIPIDAYKRKDCFEFINNPDGSISILIKNVLFK